MPKHCKEITVYGCYRLGEPTAAQIEALQQKKTMVLETSREHDLRNTFFVRTTLQDETQLVVLVYYHDRKTRAMCKKLRDWDPSAIVLPLEDTATQPV